MSNLLVLGGSYMQSGLIETAIKLGHNICVLDRDANCFVSKWPEIKFEVLDIANISEVGDFIDRNSFDACIAPVSEIGNKTLSSLYEVKKSFRYNSLKSIEATTDKIEMRRILRNGRLPEIRSFKFSNDLITSDLDFPIIVKPAVSSASRGVSLVTEKTQIEKALSYAFEYAKDQEVIIEEFIEGDQYSIETVSSNGKHHVVAIVREHMSPMPFFYERTDTISIREHSNLRSRFEDYVNILLNLLDIQVGPCHIEVKVDQRGDIYLIECASRSGGFRDRLISAAGHCDYSELIIDSYLGKDIDDKNIGVPRYNAAVGILMFPEDMLQYHLAKKDGVLVDEFFYDKTPKPNPKQLTDAFGYFFVRSSMDISSYVLNLS